MQYPESKGLKSMPISHILSNKVNEARKSLKEQNSKNNRHLVFHYANPDLYRTWFLQILSKLAFLNSWSFSKNSALDATALPSYAGGNGECRTVKKRIEQETKEELTLEGLLIWLGSEFPFLPPKTWPDSFFFSAASLWKRTGGKGKKSKAGEEEQEV